MSRIRSLAIASAIIIAPLGVLTAQTATTYPTNDPVIQRIFKLGMDRCFSTPSGRVSRRARA
jgi:hypothetical protein